MRCLDRSIAMLIMLLLTYSGMRAQPNDATVEARVIFDPRPDVITFDLMLTRDSDRWDYWANGTFRIELPDLAPTGGLNPAVHQVSYAVGSSDLPITTYDAVGMNGYYITPRIMNNRISITIHGTDSVANAYQLLPQQRTIRLGRFLISTLDGSALNENIAFIQPETYYQANAFKIDHDSVTGVGTDRNVWYERQDNIEMITTYVTRPPDNPDCDTNLVTDFQGEYIGDLAVEMQFKSLCELYIEGFIIERALVDRRTPGQLNFQYRAHLDYKNNPQLVACPTCPGGRIYTNILDGVPYRREIYAYRLISVRQQSLERRIHDTIFVRIPNAILSNGGVLDNPIKERARIIFNADDRVRVSGAAYDVGGRKLGDLVDEQGLPLVDRELPKGVGYRAFFDLKDIASQGLINFVLIGYPINDTSIEELSRIVLKAQHLR